MNIIGLMSGTSLDGLDIALCHFDNESHFKLIAAETVPYPDPWRQRLASLHLASAMEYALTDVELGHYFGLCVNKFRSTHPYPVDCIASHGHTVFHQPERHLTAQIGDGNAIHAETGLPVVCDFRRLDVALGGQGAPLVPIGDRLLFGQYTCCVNLGGIANISFDTDGQRIAYDICPCNMALNLLASRTGVPFDHDGDIARQGTLSDSLLQEMENLSYYNSTPPKTLGKEWFEQNFLPLLKKHASLTPADLLRTVTEHAALRIASSINETPEGPVLLSGGGARNTFLRQRISDLLNAGYIHHHSLHDADPAIVDFKEAIIFALLAFLRLKGQNNTLASVTGALRDSCGGLLCGELKNEDWKSEQ